MSEDGESTNATNEAGKGDNPNSKDVGDDKGDGRDNDNNSLLSKATIAAERLEAANKVMSDNLDRQEKLAAESLLGGTTGGHVKTEPKEETPLEYRNRIDKEIAEGKHDD